MSTPASDVVKALLEWSRQHDDPEAFLRDVRDGLAKHVRLGDQTVRAEIVTPDGKAAELVAAVEELLKNKFSGPVEVIERADPALIGGAVVTFGDEQIDMSVRGALRQAAQAFASGATHSS